MARRPGCERDRFGRLATVTGPDGSVTRLAWTAEGRLASRDPPGRGAERYSYDGEGNLIGHLDPAGGADPVRVRAALTGCPRAPGRTAPGPSSATTTRCGLTTVTHGSLTWRYEYDQAGRLVAETDYNGALTRYAYDAAGQLTGRSSAAGRQLSLYL